MKEFLKLFLMPWTYPRWRSRIGGSISLITMIVSILSLLFDAFFTPLLIVCCMALVVTGIWQVIADTREMRRLQRSFDQLLEALKDIDRS